MNEPDWCELNRFFLGYRCHWGDLERLRTLREAAAQSERRLMLLQENPVVNAPRIIEELAWQAGLRRQISKLEDELFLH